MHPILFQAGKITIYSHGMMVVSGIVAGSILSYFLIRRKHLATEYYFDNIVYTILFGIIGARITYYILYKSQFTSLKQIFYLWDGGLVSYGGFILGGLILLSLLYYQKQPLLEWLDQMSCGFFFGVALGRIGCLLAGEYNGVVFSAGSKALFHNLGVVPVSLYESILCFLIFIAALVLNLFNKKRISNGVIFSSSVFFYTVCRFIIDFWRQEPDVFMHMSLGQIFSLFLAILSSIYFVLILTKKEEKL